MRTALNGSKPQTEERGLRYLLSARSRSQNWVLRQPATRHSSLVTALRALQNRDGQRPYHTRASPESNRVNEREPYAVLKLVRRSKEAGW